MAKFIKTYEIHLSDWVEFQTIDGKTFQGTVQDISQLPDIFVEVGDPRIPDSYNRYKISVDMVKNVYSKDEPWTGYESVFEKDEPLEFVYNDDLKSRKVINKYKK